MSETTTVDLEKPMGAPGPLSAEWWDDNSKCVVVRGSLFHTDFALRLDLEKRAFLDHVENNKKLDEALQQAAARISEFVWKERLRRTSPPPLIASP
jgi:hypothetical protein